MSDTASILGPQQPKKRPLTSSQEIIVVVDDEDPDVTYIPPEAYSPLKKKKKRIEAAKLTDAEKTLTENEDLKVTFVQDGIKLPHAREHCTEKKFLKGFTDNNAVTTNKNICEQCYCFVCEVIASKCKFWSTGLKPHCNSYAKNAIWENVKRNNRLDSEFIFMFFSEEDKEFGINPSCPDPTTWMKLLDMKAFLRDYEDDKAVVIPCFCACHDKPGERCKECVHNKCGDRIWCVSFRDVNKSFSKFIQYCQEKLEKDLDAVVAILLDGFTSLIMLPGFRTAKDIMNNKTEIKRLFERLSKRWIELFVNAHLSEKAIDKLRQRLRNVIMTSEFVELKYFLQDAVDVLPWGVIYSMISCPETTCIKQTQAEAEARVTYLREKTMWQMIMDYGAIVTIKDMYRKMLDSSIFYLRSVRMLLPFVLAKLGKVVEAVIMSDAIYYMVLPERVMKSLCGKQANLTLTDLKLIASYAGRPDVASPLLEFSEDQFKNFVLLLRGDNVGIYENDKHDLEHSPRVNTLPPEVLKLMLIVTIRGLVMNRQLHNPTLLPFLAKAMVSTSTNISTKENGLRNYTHANAKIVKTLIDKAKRDALNADHLEIGIPLQALAVQVLVILGIYKATVKENVLKICWFNELGRTFSSGSNTEAFLTLAYGSLEYRIVPPSDFITKMIETSLPIFGVTILPVDIYRSWFNSKDIAGKVLVKLWRMLFLNTKPENNVSNHEREMRKSIRNDLGKFLNKLISDIVKDPLSYERSALINLEILCKTHKDTWQYPLRDFHLAFLEVEFKMRPKFETVQVLKANTRRDEWELCTKRCCAYIKQNSRSIGVQKCLDIFFHLALFQEMKEFVTNHKIDETFQKQVSEMVNDACKGSCERNVKYIDGFHVWLGNLVVDSFIKYRVVKVPEKVVDLLRKLTNSDPSLLGDVLKVALGLFEQHLDKAVCSTTMRTCAVEWLIHVKDICKEWGKLTEFSRLYHSLMDGNLKRKKVLINDLAKCNTGDILSQKSLEIMNSRPSKHVRQKSEKSKSKKHK